MSFFFIFELFSLFSLSTSPPPPEKKTYPHRQTQLVEAEPHQVHLELPLRGTQPAHDDALARRDLFCCFVVF